MFILAAKLQYNTIHCCSPRNSRAYVCALKSIVFDKVPVSLVLKQFGKTVSI